jgi:hypothetical protein
MLNGFYSESMEASLQDLRERLAAEHEAQIQMLRQEEEKIQSQRTEEFKKRLENDRVRIEQQTSEHVAKLEQELACKLEKERAQLERAHNELLQELTRKNELEIESTITQLQAELTAHKDELQQAHLKVSYLFKLVISYYQLEIVWKKIKPFSECKK